MNLSKKTAIVFFNLGGPDSLNGVQKFLFNLFNDRAIINLPQPFRFALAQLISRRRNKKAQGIYQQIGGKSPLLDFTVAQAEALERELSFFGDFKVFIAMRYAKPFAAETIVEIKKYGADEIILLPLYPQFSSTTTASSITDFVNKFSKTFTKKDKKPRIKTICCYADNPDLALSYATSIQNELLLNNIKNLSEIRFLFSAHGLPQKVINQGDPYVEQVQTTTTNTVKKLAELTKIDATKFDVSVCYQSKVGPLQWTSPSLESELRRAILDQKIPLIVPISFVSDHSETLVELDIEYRQLANSLGAKNYLRAASLNDNNTFITTLKNICLEASNDQQNQGHNPILCDAKPTRFCNKKQRLCINPNPCAA